MRHNKKANTGGKKRGQKYSRGIAKNAKESSKTFKGVAEAMASQFISFISSGSSVIEWENGNNTSNNE